MTPYRTEPLPLCGYPPGIPYIIGNEAAERFSYYSIFKFFLLDKMGDNVGLRQEESPPFSPPRCRSLRVT